jgi:aminoglycoside phosphotransferase (APT) family kinase protein
LTRQHTLADELDILRARLASARDALPQLATRIGHVADACVRLAEAMPEVKPRCIHRDFYADQAIVDRDRICLVDLDLLALGDPALDAGNFIGHLIELGLRRPREEARLSEAATAFEERFLEASREDSRRRIHGFTTLSLARHIFLSTQFADRRAFIVRVLEGCEERLAISAK